MSQDELRTHHGGCHCGAVRFRFEAPAKVLAQRCNCSICAMVGFEHLIVPGVRFHLLTPPQALTRYTFNTATAQHLFCATCGVKSYYVPRSNPDGFSINVRCVDRSTFESIEFEAFDGRNWERHGASLAHLSQD